MPVPPKIANLIEQLHQEINQTEQAVTEGLQIARLKLNNYPDNSFLIQIYASLSNYLVFIEISRRRIDYSQVIVASEAVAETQIQEVGEMLSEILGRVLEAKIVVNRIKARLESWS
jgi:hypothetical protein